ncbi:membrane protein [Fibrobacterales bacterium]|nr:membrane protein [Fibrobacterales bacterium]
MGVGWEVIGAIRVAYSVKRPLTWCLLVVLPCLLVAFVAVLFSERYPLKISLGVIVEDNSQGTRDLLFKLKNEPALNVVKICISQEECESALRGEEVLGVVQIPADLERKAMRGENPVVPLYLSGQSLIAYNMIEMAVNTAVGEYSAGVRSVVSSAGALSVVPPAGMPPLKIPPVVVPPNPIGLQMHAIGNPSMDYRAYLGVGLIAATFHLASMVFAAFILGTLLRDNLVGKYLDLLSPNSSSSSFLSARGGRAAWAVAPFLLKGGRSGGGVKLFFALSVPAILILFFQHALFGFAFHYWTGFSFDLWQWGILALAAFLMIVAAFGFCGTALAITKDMRIATSAGGVIGGPAFAFAGMAFPIFAMPLAVQYFAFLLPLTHFLQIQNAVRMGAIALPFIEREMLILAVFAAVWFGGAAWGMSARYKR